MPVKAPSKNGNHAPHGRLYVANTLPSGAAYATPQGPLPGLPPFPPGWSDKNMARLEDLVHNITGMRRDLFRALLDPRRDYDDECGFPKQPTVENYRDLYEREPLAARAVEVYARESWQVFPEVYEAEEGDEVTAFEESWDGLGGQTYGEANWYADELGSPVWTALRRADEAAGVGHYGILLFGLDDGRPLSEPADMKPGNKVRCRLPYLRIFPEHLAPITAFEQDPKKPRYGWPTRYSLTFNDPRWGEQGMGLGAPTVTQEVHWTRVQHVTDTGEVYHPPRLRTVLNNVVNLKKLYGGSAEMYWRGAFPGLSLESNPQMGSDVLMDPDKIRDMMENYANGLQRYLALMGMQAKTLSPTVVEPTAQINVQIEAIAVRLGIPLRVLKGSERGELASSQDDKAWNDRLAHHQHSHNTPHLIVPFVNRLISLGVLPVPKSKKFKVAWPDLTSKSDQEKAQVAVTQTQALSAYVAGGVDALVPPLDFLTRVMGWEDEVATTVLEAAEELAAEKEAEQALQAQEQAKLGGPTPPDEEEGTGVVEEAEAEVGPGGDPEFAAIVGNCGGPGSGIPGPCPTGAKKASTLLGMAAGLPGKVWSGIKAKVADKYKTLEKRYGSKYAKAILGAALAGVPIPLPGSSFITAAPVLAVAEMHRFISGPTGNADAPEEMSEDEVRAAALQLLKELKAELAPLLEGSEGVKLGQPAQEPAENANPEGCNQHTGPGCGTGGGNAEDKANAVLELSRKITGWEGNPEIEALHERLRSVKVPPKAEQAILSAATGGPADNRQLYEAARKASPKLTKEEFKAALLQLKDSGRLSLSPYTRSAGSFVRDSKGDPDLLLPQEGDAAYYAQVRNQEAAENAAVDREALREVLADLPEGAMPGYGQVYVNGGEVWYVGGDGDEDEFVRETQKRLAKVPGVTKVHYEAEAFPPKSQGWTKFAVNAGSSHFSTCDRDDKGRCLHGEGSGKGADGPRDVASLQAPVKSTKPLGGGVNQTELVTLTNGVKGVWKPVEGARGGADVGRRQAASEVAASEAANVLGLGHLVPASTLREVGGKEGTVQEFVSNALMPKDANNPYDGDKDLHGAAALDYLMGQSDRHTNNWVLPQEGKGLFARIADRFKEAKDGTGLRLIDNGLGFKDAESVGDFQNCDLLRECVSRPVPREFAAWKGRLPQLEASLRRSGLGDAPVGLAMARARALADAAERGGTFGDLPWAGRTVGQGMAEQKRGFRVLRIGGRLVAG